MGINSRVLITLLIEVLTLLIEVEGIIVLKIIRGVILEIYILIILYISLRYLNYILANSFINSYKLSLRSLAVAKKVRKASSLRFLEVGRSDSSYISSIEAFFRILIEYI